MAAGEAGETCSNDPSTGRDQQNENEVCGAENGGKRGRNTQEISVVVRQRNERQVNRQW